MKAGLDVDDFGPRLSFFFNAHLDFLEEVAKFRAARRLWARIMKERFRAKNPRSWMLRFHTQTAGCTLTAQQPHNNIVRVALQALAAVLGGTQSLHTNSMDEALALPTRRVGADRPADPADHRLRNRGQRTPSTPWAAPIYVEKLTDEIEKRAGGVHRQDRPDGRGGGGHRKRIHPAGNPGERLPVSEGDRSRASRVIVGVNKFQSQGAAAQGTAEGGSPGAGTSRSNDWRS